MTSHKIELRNVGFKRIENGDTFDVLKGVNLSIEPGSKVSLIGRNGRGKTTLVKILSGELVAVPYDVNTEMVVRVGTMGVAQGKSKKNGRASGVATVHQFVQDDLIDSLSVLKNIRIRQTFSGVKSEGLATADKLNSDFATYDVLHGIEPDKLVKNLSGGERQLLNVLTALKYECGSVCKLLMLDEHLNALDVIARNKTEMLIDQVLSGNIHCPTIIMVTHDLEMAVSHSEKIVALDTNRTAIEYKVQDLLNAHSNDKEKVVYKLKQIII